MELCNGLEEKQKCKQETKTGRFDYTRKWINSSPLEQQVRRVIEKAALPQEYAKNFYKWIKEDEITEKQLAEENIKKLQLELKLLLNDKLNKLLDGYLDGVIESNIYKLKKNELFEEKLKLTEEITKIQTNGSTWLEPFREFIDSALSCAKIAGAKNTCSDLSIGAKTVGSNFFLTNRQLSLNYNQGFAELCASPSAQRNSKVLASKSRSVDSRGIEPLTFAV